MDRCNSRRDISELMLTTALNTSQSINLQFDTLYGTNLMNKSSRIRMNVEVFLTPT